MRGTRRIAGLFLVGVLAAAATVVFGQPAQAAGGYYSIVNYGSGKCAEVNRFGSPLANGELVVQRTCDGSAVQQWAPVDAGGGVYELVNAYSGMCMDVRNGANANSTPVQQWTCTGTTSMKWTINPNSFTGVHQVLSRLGDEHRCLDVRAGALFDGAQIQIYHCTGFGNSAQVWSFSG
jgi:Ricin-type beta-trefoil lectin domain-like